MKGNESFTDVAGSPMTEDERRRTPVADTRTAHRRRRKLTGVLFRRPSTPQQIADAFEQYQNRIAVLLRQRTLRGPIAKRNEP